MQSERKIPGKFLPIIFAVLLAAGVYIGTRLNSSVIPGKASFSAKKNQLNKLTDVFNYIEQEYVDTLNEKKLVDYSIEKLLQNLDPHSAYIPVEDLQAANEQLEGNFEGIGIEFHIQQDTIMIVSTISGGPSEMVGLHPGDRIVKVNQKNVAGIGITNDDVFKYLRGPSETKVNISVLRRGNSKLIDYTITRGKIPLNSLDIAYMVDSTTGYIKLNRFSATTYNEFSSAMKKLKDEGMKELIFDLSGNPGGYLDAAIQIADEFLPAEKLIVYTLGKSRPKTVYNATAKGDFETGKVAVIIDQGSASASEIIAGALQDWDRATIIGRRSFGKGLVQEQTVFNDGSALRLTIARYYTPTGRSIQKAYNIGYEAYNNELFERFRHGEMEYSDSIKIADTLKFKTPGGKTVYGGGGIMPDVFIPLDTSLNSEYFNNLFRLGLISQFAYNYVDENRTQLSNFHDLKLFRQHFSITDELLEKFIAFADKNGVKKDNAGISISEKLIRTYLIANIARQLFGNEGFYPVLAEVDSAFLKAVEIIKSSAE
ncbi:MAG: S41 family peptidase [Bacteroidia bacterium]